MRLYLVQHGDNLSEAVDPQKPLSAKGRRDIEGLAKALKDFRVSVVEVIHSGKLRAAQSAEIIAESLDVPVSSSAGLDPMDPVKPFASRVRTWTEERIVVGHLPFMERLATHLVAGREEPPAVTFQRGGMICLDYREGSWRVAWTALPDQPRLPPSGGK